MIFVTGCARSGTSLTTKILQAHGCYLGKRDQVNALYENTGFRQNHLKPYLKRNGADPMGQKVLPNTDNLKPWPDLRETLLNYVGDKEPWAYKDAKLSTVWPVFHEAFPEAKWVLVRRDKERIVDSCMRTEFMHSYSHRKPWQEWVEAHEQRFDKMRKELDLIEVWPDEVVQDAHAFEPVAQFLNLPFDLHATEQCIDKRKWHNAA